MKKFLLSAVVTSLFVPMAYAMDGAAPAVDVDLPAVAVDDIPVDNLPLDLPTPDLDPCPLPVVDVDGPNVAICHLGGVFINAFDDNGKPIEVDEEHPGVAVCYIGGMFNDELDENGEPLIRCQDFPMGQPGDGEGDTFDWSLSSSSGVAGGGQSEIRTFGSLTHRGGNADQGSEDAPNPQQLGDELRGSVRHHGADTVPAQPQSGMGKLFAKFHAPAADATPASTPKADNVLSAKLADIDRMRDTALRTGDQKMLAKADKLEQALRGKPAQTSKLSSRSK